MAAHVTPSDSSSLLQRLATRQVDGWTEADVREEFITPLLRLLGYEKGTDYDINRESQHLLSKPFLMIGSKKQKLDYALMVRKRTFWILEAKRPDPPEIAEEAIFQAHFYALHPEVSCRYFGVCNGREIVVFDARNVDAGYAPLLKISATELPARFGELRDLIGASCLVRHLKSRILNDTRALLSAEVREEQVEEFAADFRKVVADVTPTVRENRMRVWSRKHQQHERTFAQLADDASLAELPAVLLEFAQNRAELDVAYSRFKAKLDCIDENARVAELAKAVRLLENVPGTRHRFNVLHLLLRVECPAHLTATIRDFVRDAIRGYASRPAARAQWKFEAVLHRAMYKASFASPSLLRQFELGVQTKLRTLGDEDIVWQNPSIWGERHAWVRAHIDEIWRKFCRAPSHVLDELISDLSRLELDVEEQWGDEIRKRTANEGDLTWYADYDRPFDYMRSNLCGVLLSELETVNALLDEEDLDYLGGILGRVSESYVVNHADTLWMRMTCLRGRVSLPTQLPPDVAARLSPAEIPQFLISAHANRRGRSALSDGVRVSGAAPRGYVQIEVRLDPDSRRVALESLRALD